MVFVVFHLLWTLLFVLKGRDSYKQGVEPIWLEKGLFWLETNQQVGGKNPQIFIPVSAFSAIVGVSLKCVLQYHSVSAT